MKPLVLALLLVGGAAPRAGAQNMVVYDDGLESGWRKNGWATINYANPAPVQSGTASISVSAGAHYQALYLGHARFDPSLYQSLAFWIYPTLSGSNELQVRATLDGEPQAAVPLSFTAAQVNQWQLITIPIQALGVAGNASFNGFWIQNISGQPVTFYVDSISLIAAPPPNPAPLTVNARDVIRKIDSRMYGINLAVWDRFLAGPPTPALLAAMGTGAVRFPGGSASDDYDWHTGRGVSKNTRWPNNAATFARVTETQRAQAYVTVNYGSCTPEEAAAWVAYYNASTTGTAPLGVDSRGADWKTDGYWAAIRAGAPLAADDGYNFLRAAHPAPYGFKYWEIGNECYGGWENDLHGRTGSGLSGAVHDPSTYALAFRDFFNRMRAVDPSIRIGAVATADENSYGNGARGVANPNEGNSIHGGWTPIVIATLKSLGVMPQFLIYHTYAQSPGKEDDAFLLQAGAKIKADAVSLRKMITDYVGESGSSIELDVTEMNSVSSDPGKQSTSLVNALFMADAIGNLAETEFNACIWWDLRNGGGARANNNRLLYGWRDYGDYGLVSSGYGRAAPGNTPYPTYYAANLLMHWGRGGDAVVSAASGYKLLSIHAARLADGSLALLVINKNPTADLPARITLRDFTPAPGDAAIYSYGKANDLAGAPVTSGTAVIPGATFDHTFPSYSMSVLVVKGR